jgi:hypothetical protein
LYRPRIEGDVATDSEISDAFKALYGRFDNVPRFVSDPPLLAHYTSMPVLESILRDETIWFSNPLFMNDLQEMRFGLIEGKILFSEPERLLKAAGTQSRAQLLAHVFDHYFSTFENDGGAFDTYVFCLSEHDRSDADGLLSMWRGYGASGDGAALIFNPANVEVIPNSVLFIAQVKYGSTDERLADLKAMLDGWAALTATIQLPDDKLYIPAFHAMTLLKLFALTTKHRGFSEEREWRLVYLAENDSGDRLRKYFSYHIGPRGVEPKLKLKVTSIPGVTGSNLSMDRLLHQIILGPTVSSPLVKQSVLRMLEAIEKPQYKDRVKASSIPLRAFS